MKNQYTVIDDVVFMTLKRNDGTVMQTCFDAEDLNRIVSLGYTWGTWKGKNANSYYVRTEVKSKTIWLHRFIMNAPKGMVVDHINHDALDNRKKNLRILKQSQNMQNQTVRKDNKTGIRGVTWDKKMGAWRVRVGVNWERRHVGFFNDLNEAIEAAENARAQLMPYSLDAIEMET